MFSKIDYKKTKFRDYNIIFTKSKTKNKKYDALITSKNGDTKKVSFGDKRYGQYHDKIGFYGHLDHHDSERKRLYELRHKTEFAVPLTANWLSSKFLWS